MKKKKTLWEEKILKVSQKKKQKEADGGEGGVCRPWEPVCLGLETQKVFKHRLDDICLISSL